MNIEIIIQIILLGIALSMDAFAVSITDGLIYRNLNKRRMLFIALTFAIMQGLMPLSGYYLIELVEHFVKGTSEKAGEIMSLVVVWIAFALLLFIGIKMLIEAIIALKKNDEEKEIKYFSYKEVLLFGIATSIDALASGVAMHAGLSNNTTIWLHIAIISVITFLICLIGVFLGKQITRLLKGKYEISGIIGGMILILLAIWVVLSHYFGL